MKKVERLTSEQRYFISLMLQNGQNQAQIAKMLGKDRSVISRELKRNMGKHRYSYTRAEMLTKERQQWRKHPKKMTKQMIAFIEERLINEQWSPEQIVGYAKRMGIKMVSHERIYQHIREDKKRGGKLYLNLRHKLKHRKRPVGKYSPIKDKVSIDDRPKIVDEKRRYGDWEIDLIIDQYGNAILTAAERKSQYTLIQELPEGKHAKPLAKQAIKLFAPFINTIQSLTSDNGTEFTEHKIIAKALKTMYFFAHPYSSWERGLSEYTNKLIRQYIPKNANFKNFTLEQLKEIQYKLNSRPRKSLNYDNPKNVLFNNI